MKKFLVFLCTTMLVFGMAATVSAVLVDVTFTGDNKIASWSVDSIAKDSSSLSLSDWTIPDTVPLDLAEGSHTIIWSVEDLNDGYDSVGFLGQIASDENILTSSNAWDIGYEDSGGWIPATEYAANGGYPWVVTLPGIDASAFWIWAPPGDYVPNAQIRAQFTIGSPLTYDNNTPVPEPATMLLLGTGLFGLAALGRKRFLKK